MDLMEFESDDGPNSWVGSSGIGARVAVLDTGIYPEHQDFCGDNGTFNESAQIMDVSTCDALDAPYDFVTGGTPTSSDILDGIKAVTGADYEDEDAAPYDKNGHGTHVSGIIGARVNGEGIGGAAYNATILPIRVLAPYLDKDDDLIGLGQTSWIVNGINYAVTNNADVINMSLGGIFNTNDDLIMISAINAAYNAGVLIVAAAGNESSDFDNTKVAPAYYSNVMSVSSVNNTGQFASGYSNFGDSLDVAAVGTYVYNAGINSPVSYVYQTGTSMATPYVSALAALIVSKNNLNGSEALSPDDIRSIIKDTASNATTPNEEFGYGIINANAAIALINNFDPTDADTYPSLYSNKVLCYPNPFYRNQSNFTDCSIIQNQTGSAEYSVYSRRGQQVASGGLTISSTKSIFSWNGTDLNGDRLPNGVYQLVLTLTPSDGTSSPVTYKHLVTLL